jgi:uncharacterized protein
MNVQLPQRDRLAAAGTAVIDGDIHPKNNSPAELRPFLSDRWWDYLVTYGNRPRHGNSVGFQYPKGTPGAYRRDAWPEGETPGGNLDFMRAQLLDPLGITMGVMNPLTPSGHGDLNADFAAAMSAATNDWQLHKFCHPEPRLRASICIPYEDAPAAVTEIHKRAGDPNFCQVLLLSRTSEPAGQRRYWPIYEAAQETGFPVGFHAFGNSGVPLTPGGWPSFYIEEVQAHAASTASLLTSLLIEGVFERFPKLKVVLIEGGFGWIPAVLWRLDHMFERFRGETPHLKRRPSEYFRDHVWTTTQPFEEAEHPSHILDAMEWIGWDRILFATDYPHWDFDDPRVTFPRGITAAQRQMVLNGNAANVYPRL